jgi:hypothetical protein
VESISKRVYETVLNSPCGKVSSIADQGSLEVIEGLGHFFPRSESRLSLVLEIGGGIGTITRLLLEVFESDIVCLETNEFCLGELRKLKMQLLKEKQNRLHIVSEFGMISTLFQSQSSQIDRNFLAIFIDGPISYKELSMAIEKSTELKFVFVQGWRLWQRFQVSTLLLRSRFHQQYIEIRHDEKVTSAIFFTTGTSQMKFRFFRSFLAFITTLIPLVPKLVKNKGQAMVHLILGKKSRKKLCL